MRNLIFLDRPFELKEIADFRKLISEDSAFEGAIVIAGDPVLWWNLKNANIPVIPLSEYQQSKDLDKIFDQSLHLAGSWFLNSEGKDISTVHSVSLGQSLKLHVSQWLHALLKTVCNVRRILSQEQPQIVWLLESFHESGVVEPIEADIYGEVFRMFESEKGFQIRPIRLSLDSIRGKEKLNDWKLELLGFTPGRLAIPLPKNLVRFAKRILISFVDGFKSVKNRLTSSRKGVRALVVGASDISYLGLPFTDRFTRSAENRLFYIESEMNCYKNPRLLHVGDDCLPSSILDDEEKRCLKALRNHVAELKSDLLWTQEDKSILDLARPFLENLLINKFPSLFHWINAVEISHHKHKINLILITNHLMPKSNLISEIGRKLEVPVFYIPHGHNHGNFIDGKPTFNYNIDRKYFPYNVDCQLVGLKLNQRLLENNGHDPEKMALCGLPKFERPINNSEKNRETAKRVLGFDSNEFVVVFPTTVASSITERISNRLQLSAFDCLQLESGLVQAFESVSGIKLIFKFRPQDILIKPIERAIERSNGAVSLTTENLDLLLRGADALFVWSSQVGLEALFYDIPIFQYRFPGKPVLLPLFIEGAAFPVENLEDLPSILKRLKEDPNFRQERLEAQRKFLKDNLPGEPGTAAKRTVDLAFKLALGKIS